MSLLEKKPFVENWWVVICKETSCQVEHKSCILLCRPALLAATLYPLLQVLQPVLFTVLATVQPLLSSRSGKMGCGCLTGVDRLIEVGVP